MNTKTTVRNTDKRRLPERAHSDDSWPPIVTYSNTILIFRQQAECIVQLSVGAKQQ